MQDVKKKNKRNLLKIVVFFMTVLTLFTSLVLPVGAEENVQSDAAMYDDIAVSRFYEQGYGTDNFELLVFIYNPLLRDVVTSDARNKIQIGYSADESKIFSTTYKKYALSFEEQNGSYILFKIIGFEMPVDTVRYYAVSGIELFINGDINATDFPVSTVYKCETVNGENIISTDVLPSVDVDVYHTFYRTGYSDKNAGLLTGGIAGLPPRQDNDFIYWQNQISSCYFALPSSFTMGEHDVNTGLLESVTAEFTSYLTAPMLLTNSTEFYELYRAVLGTDITGKSEYNNLAFSHNKVISCDCKDSICVAKFAYGSNNTVGNHPDLDYLTGKLGWLFYDAGINDDGFYLSGDVIESTFNNYVQKYGREQAINDLLIDNPELYEAMNISLCGFKQGYNKHTYSIAYNADSGDITSLGLKLPNQNFLQWVFGVSESNDVILDPLVKIDENDLTLKAEDFSKKYYVEINEIPHLRTYFREQKAQGKDTWIMRYDACEYYYSSQKVNGLETYSSGVGTKPEKTSFTTSMQSVYLDFDVLSFKFAQNGVIYTVSNTASPEDVFNDVTGNTNEKTSFGAWLKNVLLPTLGVWGVFILACAVGVLILYGEIKIMISIIRTGWHWAWKLGLILLSVAVIGVVLWFTLPWIINVINGFGGL